MEVFPDLKPYQVALLRAERSTGHVLDEKFNLVLAASQTVFTIFDDLSAALRYGKRIVESNPEVECVIYRADKTVAEYITPSTKSS